jgi:hypothetical protein
MNETFIETNYQISCPYCFEQIWQEFYPEDGTHQDLIIDCEVCCRPIQFIVSFSNGVASIDARRS